MNAFFEEVYAIVLRDWMKRSKLWKALLGLLMLGAVILAFGYGMQLIVKPLFSAGYSSFFSFGFLIYVIFIAGIMNGSDIILDRQKFVRLLLVAPISKYSILVGKTLSLTVSYFRVFLFLGILFLLSSLQFSFVKFLILIIFGSFLLLVSVASGLFVSSLFEDKKTAEKVIGTITFVLLFTSGVLFPVSVLPNFLQFLFRLNPLIYAVDLFRFLMIGTHEFSLLLNLSVSIGFGSLMVFLGVYGFDKNMRK